ncbi:MAG TPA: chemotaxis protein CheA, partial [Syntrophorhabdales bacterium]|nr:chemotaxis protein CheA [Syntrophorhabdales bacterium]
MQERHIDTYREEAHELLSELESSLLELEGSPGDMELVGRIFRAMHTIKGSGAMFGFDEIAAFTHEVETVFDNVRHGTLQVTRDLIDLTLKVRDCIRLMLDEPGNKETEEMAAAILSSLRALASGGNESETTEEWTAAEPTSSEGSQALPTEGGSQTYRIRFTPARHLFRTGTNPLPLLNELRSLGECSIAAHFGAIPPLEAIDPESCYARWDIILTTSQGLNAVKDVFIFVENDAEVRIEAIDEDPAVEGDVKRLGEILVERGDVGRQDVERVLQERKPIGELLVESGVTTSAKVASALSEQEHVREVREKRKTEEAVSSIRVSADKLDKLVDLVGELVTIQARLTEKAVSGKDPELLFVAEEVERLTNELRDNTMSIRMLPIGSTFSRFKRLVRDLSKELGKEIELYTEGAETELDKTVIERLNDPLVHIIRNSVDHGIEEPSVREQLGKPRVGTIVLSAKHSGGNVLIDITDDGKGLHKETLRLKAVEKGLVSPDAEMSEKEIFSLIFAPGFS